MIGFLLTRINIDSIIKYTNSNYRWTIIIIPQGKVMPNYNTETLGELAQTVVNPTPEHTDTITAPVCKPGDKECVARWIQAFSDCE